MERFKVIKSGFFLIAAAWAMLPPATASAQISPPAATAPTNRATADRTLVLEILIQPQPRDRIRAQDWGRSLQQLGYSPKFRSPMPGEKMRIEESDVDGRPRVLVVAGLNPDGSLEIGNRRFSVADGTAIDSLLQSLKQNGTSGTAGNPRWGLSEQQFLDFSRLISDPIEQPVVLSTPAASVKQLALPAEIPIMFADQALQASLQQRPESAPMELDLTGLSRGTALAVLLSQYGLGFRPALTRQGNFVVEIHPGGEADNLWPIGWKTLEPTPDVLPAWLKSIPFDIQDADLNSLIEAVAEKLRIPVYKSSQKIAAADLALDELTWSRSGKLSPFNMLRTVGEKFELGFDVRADEAGRLFLWATTRAEADAFNRRFAHIRPPK
jgi:hypothetical protein